MTRLFGVIGDPIDHSLSPVMHNAALRALRIDAYYGRFQTPAPVLRQTLKGLLAAGCEGLNVTVPLKERILPLMDRLEPQAKAMRAVNTVIVRRGRMLGVNTDGIGFRKALQELGAKPGPMAAVILGAGGAARAVAWELSCYPGSRLYIANRHVERARQLARWLSSERRNLSVESLSLHDVQLDEAHVLINTTTVGMQPKDGLLVEPDQLRKGLIVYDLVYHRQTALVKEALRRGCVAANGLSMLLYQGAASLEAWLGIDAPIAVMRRALTDALGLQTSTHAQKKLPSKRSR